MLRNIIWELTTGKSTKQVYMKTNGDGGCGAGSGGGAYDNNDDSMLVIST